MNTDKKNTAQNEYTEDDINALLEEIKQLQLFKTAQEEKQQFDETLDELKVLLERKPQQTIEEWIDRWVVKLIPKLRGVQAVMYWVMDESSDQSAETEISFQYISGFATSAKARQTLAKINNELLLHVATTQSAYEVTLTHPPVLQSAAQMQISPQSLLIHPFTYQGVVMGVLEVYLLESLHPMQRQLLTNIEQSVASSLRAYQDQIKLEASFEQVHQSKVRHQNILDNTQQALALLDPNGVVADANNAFFQLLDYKSKPLGQVRFLDHLADESDQKHVQQAMIDLLASQQKNQIVTLRFAGSYSGNIKYKLHFTKIISPNQPDYILAQLLGYSIINKKNQHTELSFEILNDAMLEVFIFDMHNLQVLYANKSALRNIEYPLAELKMKIFAEFMPQFDEEALAEIIKVLSNSEKQYIQFEVELRRQDRSLYGANMRLMLTSYKTKPVVVAMVQDITRRKDLERELLLQGDKITKELTRKVNEKEQKLEREKARTQDINQQIIQQNKIIASKSKDMFDSLQYAKIIQESILPSEVIMRKHLMESFVYYQAKDVVSGDFYWVHQKGQKVFLVAADCTGHGVPGALLTMLGSNLLKEIIKSSVSDDPAEILEQLDKMVIESLHHEGDGMDIALCVIDKQNNRVLFSGAKNPLIYIKNNQLHRIKGGIRSIGGGGRTMNPFTTQHIMIDRPTAFYMFSDGYQDQFGGEEDKKFMVKGFKDLLLSIHLRPMAEQKQIIDDTMKNWIGARSQTDDLLVMGFKLSNS